MRKSGTHSARAKRPAGKRGIRKKKTHLPVVAFCVLAAAALATGYGLTHQRAPETKASAATPLAPAAAETKDIADTRNGDTPVSEQALRKEDRLVTGSIPAREEIAPPVILPKPKPEAAKKKKSAAAKTQAPEFIADDIKPESQQKR
jgi:hypothetical protein